MLTIAPAALLDERSLSDLAVVVFALLAVAGGVLFVMGRRQRRNENRDVVPIVARTDDLGRLSRATSLALVLASFALLGSAALVGLRIADGHDIEAVDEDTTTESTITVAGRGAAPLVPDTAVIVVGIETVWSPGETADSTYDSIIQSAVAAGVAPDDIRPVADQVTMADEQFRRERRVALTVRDLGQLDAVLSAISASGVTITGVGIGVADPSAALAAAHAEAIEDAHLKADRIANAIGATVVGVTNVVEYSVSRLPTPLEVATADPSAPPQPSTQEAVVELQTTFRIE